MIDLNHYVKQYLQESIQINNELIEAYSARIAQASELLVNCLLNNHKILCCGDNDSTHAAKLFASAMLNQHEIERPGLPALALNTGGKNYDYLFAKQLKTFGMAGDVLLVINVNDKATDIIEAIRTAHQRGLTVILLSSINSEIGDLLTGQDIEIQVSSRIKTRAQEAHILIIHCLCDIIDQQIFMTE